MYAIVEINGQQFKVAQNQEIFVHRLEGNAGDAVSFDKVLLIDNNGAIQVGLPILEGAVINATIVDHLKGDKVIIFKKKRRKGYRVKNGFRQSFTKIKIEGIA
jgi:large subunit ribosomal protein L21